jgi:protein-lysine N-methyltransferase EEF2KMT
MAARKTSATTQIPLGRLESKSTAEVAECLGFIRDLYFPIPPTENSGAAQLATVQGLHLPKKLGIPLRAVKHLIHDESVPDSGYASATEDVQGDEESTEESWEILEEEDEEEEEDSEALRNDAFERDFTIRWLSGFLARSEIWACLVEDNEDDYALRVELSDEASTILSWFTKSSGGEDEQDEEEDQSVIRKFEFSNGVEVSLNDAPLSENDHTSVGLQSWASAIILTQRFCETPSKYFPTNQKSKILELGAGTGLLSIAAAKLGVAEQIVATDYHPDVLNNLRVNVSTNLPSSSKADFTIPQVCKLDWEKPDYTLPELKDKFDIIIAADVIYHPGHAKWIRGVVEDVLIPPSSANPEGGVCWLAMAIRITGRHEGLDKTVGDVFPLMDEADKTGSAEQKLAIVEQEFVKRMDGVGRADESGYKIFKICWV